MYHLLYIAFFKVYYKINLPAIYSETNTFTGRNRILLISLPYFNFSIKRFIFCPWHSWQTNS
ncbi:MAG: hypothetical protein A2X59_00130 [Nitrospirae bacterium GWC2_42_7]|nr:MAG: hypothetical protein A2X59_00130 [Nitrospirae bacterium GWC2_42_7]